MAIQGVFYVAIHVSDLARSRQFYGQVLGWKQGTDEPTVAGFHFGSGYLVVLADPAHAGAARIGGMQVAVQVTDIESEYGKLRDAGIEASQLLTQPWGERNFSFRDPDGYEWSYGEIGGR